eukprot:gene8915-16540_t
MASDPALLKAKEKAKENFSFSEPENFFSDLPKGDLVAFARARDEWYHARIVEVEMIKIYRERLEKCYARDPVNHKQNCRKMALEYLAAWDNYRDNKTYIRTPGGNIDRFKPTIEEMKDFVKNR